MKKRTVKIGILLFFVVLANFWKLHMYYVNNFQFHKHVKCR